MALTSLEIRHFRIIDEATLNLSPQVNIVVGANGAGKTSLLEAVHVLARARSFRSTSIDSLIKHSHKQLGVYGRVRLTDPGSSEETPVGIEKNGAETRIRLAGRAIGTASELASWFPLQVIGADSFRLITEGAGERRAFLDWGIFQSAPEQVKYWQRFNLALKQRNAALKNKMETAVCSAWDDDLALCGEKINQLRCEYLEKLLPVFGLVWDHFYLDIPRPNFRYVRGWAQDVGYRESLAQGLLRDREYGYTRVGPQRAELHFDVNGNSADEVFSRGQTKLLAVTLLVAQAQLLTRADTKTSPMVLVDDITAELDSDNAKRTMSLLLDNPVQLFVTTLDRQLTFLPKQANDAINMFHVEHGRFSVL